MITSYRVAFYFLVSFFFFLFFLSVYGRRLVTPLRGHVLRPAMWTPGNSLPHAEALWSTSMFEPGTARSGQGSGGVKDV